MTLRNSSVQGGVYGLGALVWGHALFRVGLCGIERKISCWGNRTIDPQNKRSATQVHKDRCYEFLM